MAITSSPSNAGPASWRALFNDVFGLDRWSVVLTYTFTTAALAREALPRLYVVSVPKRACKVIVQEWPDGGYSYFLESRHFDLGQVRRELEMWRDNLI